MSVNATPPGADGLVRLWAANAEGHLAMTAEFGFDKSNLPEKTAAQHCAGE